MSSVLTFTRESMLGFKARKLRIAEHLTQHQLADMAGVSAEAVDTFEHNLPLPLDEKRRILKELWAKKQRSDALRTTPRL